MPDVLASNTMRFCTDTFGYVSDGTDGNDAGTVSAIALEKKALIQTQNGYGWNCKSIDRCTGFDFHGDLTSQPTGTKIRFVFRVVDPSVGDAYTFKTLNSAGTGLIDFSYDHTDVDDVLTYGNTLEQLRALTNIPAFVGKKVWAIIALSGRTDLEAPTVKVGLKMVRDSAVKTEEYETSTAQLIGEDYTDGDNLPVIASITPTVTTSGGGSYTAQVKLQNADDTWTSYMDLADAVGLEAKAVQFQGELKVETVGSDSVKVKKFLVEHSQGGKMVVTDGTARLYSTVCNYEVPLQSCCVTVRHNQLHDSTIEAFVNFMREPDRRELLLLGAGTGSVTSYVLGESKTTPDDNIDGSTIELYYGDTNADTLTQIKDSDFSYNLASKTVDVSVARNKVLYASYEYNHGVEVWHKMTADTPQPFVPANGTYTTRFFYTLPDSQAENKTVSNVMLRLTRNEGTATEDLGAAPSGRTRIYYLPHFAVDGSISFTNDAVDYYLDTDTNILSVTAPKGTERKFTYDWKGAEIEIISFTASWSLTTVEQADEDA